MLERIAEQAIVTGFKNVILMGDHGGGQPNVYSEVAKKLDDKYAPQGIHVYYCDEVYTKAQDDFDKWLDGNGYPRSSHAGIPDTSEMLYLGGDKGWVRKELHQDRGRRPGPAARGAAARTADPNAPRAEQRHHRRRPPVNGRARQEGVRHEGRVRREADPAVPRADSALEVSGLGARVNRAILRGEFFVRFKGRE